MEFAVLTDLVTGKVEHPITLEIESLCVFSGMLGGRKVWPTNG